MFNLRGRVPTVGMDPGPGPRRGGKTTHRVNVPFLLPVTKHGWVLVFPDPEFPAGKTPRGPGDGYRGGTVGDRTGPVPTCGQAATTKVFDYSRLTLGVRYYNPIIETVLRTSINRIAPIPINVTFEFSREANLGDLGLRNTTKQ